MKKKKDPVKLWRERKVKEGARSLSVWLDPDTVKLFDDLKKQLKCDNQELVKQAIKGFYTITCNQEKPETTKPVPKPKRKIKTMSEVFEEILNSTRQTDKDGMPAKRVKPQMKRYFKLRQKELRNSPGDIARYLNSINLKNFEGNKWKVADVKAILGI